MPLARTVTPPPESNQTALTVMDSLNAWTTDEDHEKDEPVIKKLPLGYCPCLAQADRTAPVVGWRRFFDTESDQFNLVIGLVIILNAIIIGMETDFGRGGFYVAEHLFLSIFVLEMLSRISHIGFEYFLTPSYLFDCSLVVTGMLDLWILPFMEGHHTNKHSAGYQFSVLRLLRILRLLRVLRVIRLLRMFANLLLMVKAFGKAIQVVLLLSVLVFIMIYVLGIVCTQLVGHKAAEFGDGAHIITDRFGTIPASMATLFWVMFGSGWDPLLHVLTQEYSHMLVLACFSAFMVVTVALLALIVGLISESLIIAQHEFKEKMLEKFRRTRKQLASEYTAELHDLMEARDAIDASGAVDGLELKQAVKGDATLVNRMIHAGVQTNMDGLVSLVESVTNRYTQNVPVEQFVEKLINLSGNSSASSVVDLKYDLLKNRRLMEKVNGDVESSKAELAQSRGKMDDLNRKMDEILNRIK